MPVHRRRPYRRALGQRGEGADATLVRLLDQLTHLATRMRQRARIEAGVGQFQRGQPHRP